MRVIRDSKADPARSTRNMQAAMADARALLDARQAPSSRVLGSLPRFPLPAGDPASSAGTKVDMSELAPDVLAAIAEGTVLPPTGDTIIVRPYAPGTAVGDAVFQQTDGAVGPASAIDVDHMPVMGFIAALNVPAPGLCQVQQSGDLYGFVGLTPGRIYIASKNLGQILWESDVGNPDYPALDQPGTVVQAIGVAGAPDMLNVNLQLQEVN